MSNPFLKDIPKLLADKVITEETAEKIRTYYQSEKKNSGERLLMLSGVLGSLLVGLGIILILAHNWDDLGRMVKTILAFIPLIAGQFAAWFALYRKRENQAWREAASVFLILAIGSCMAMVSQIYNLGGELSDFLLVWIAVSIPVVYVMNSGMTSVLVISGITWYGSLVGYENYPKQSPWMYLVVMAIMAPFYWKLSLNPAEKRTAGFHHILIAISVSIMLATFFNKVEPWSVTAYFSLFSFLYLIGQMPFFKENSIWNNSYQFIGLTGIFLLLFVFSFDESWREIGRDFYFSKTENYRGLGITIGFSIGALALIFFSVLQKEITKRHLPGIIFIIFIPLFPMGHFYPVVATILVNVIILFFGILLISTGAKQNDLTHLNFGLTIISILIICRFFDQDIPFVLRGIIFIGLGIGFFLSNYLTLQKRKKDLQQ